MTMPVNPVRNVPRKKAGRNSGAGNVKILLTAASVAAVMGGWAVLTVYSAPGGNGQSSEPTAIVETTQRVELPPLPTLLPPPADLPAASKRSAVVSGAPVVLPMQPAAATPALPQAAAGGRVEKESPDKAAAKAKPEPVADTKSSR